MNVQLQPDFPVTDEACKEATGKSSPEWSDAINAIPAIADKRREALRWMWDQAGHSPTARVQEEPTKRAGNVTRVRDGKDVRATWRTPGVEHDAEVEVLLAGKGGKVAITLSHSRIQTRGGADGLRRAWSEELASLKAELEASA